MYQVDPPKPVEAGFDLSLAVIISHELLVSKILELSSIACFARMKVAETT
jgi:hypothetical protein